MSARTITGSLNAFVTDNSHIGPDELKTLDDQKLVRGLYYTANDMAPHGWTLVGKAQITIALAGNKEIIEGQVTALKAQKQKVIAEAERESTRIERQIQSLLAIGYEEGGVA